MGIRSNITNAVKRVLGFGQKANPLKNIRAYQGALVSRLTSDWMASQESWLEIILMQDKPRELLK